MAEMAERVVGSYTVQVGSKQDREGHVAGCNQGDLSESSPQYGAPREDRGAPDRCGGVARYLKGISFRYKYEYDGQCYEGDDARGCFDWGR